MVLNWISHFCTYIIPSILISSVWSSGSIKSDFLLLLDVKVCLGAARASSTALDVSSRIYDKWNARCVCWEQLSRILVDNVDSLQHRLFWNCCGCSPQYKARLLLLVVLLVKQKRKWRRCVIHFSTLFGEINKLRQLHVGCTTLQDFRETYCTNFSIFN